MCSLPRLTGAVDNLAAEQVDPELGRADVVVDDNSSGRPAMADFDLTVLDDWSGLRARGSMGQRRLLQSGA